MAFGLRCGCHRPEPVVAREGCRVLSPRLTHDQSDASARNRTRRVRFLTRENPIEFVTKQAIGFVFVPLRAIYPDRWSAANARIHALMLERTDRVRSLSRAGAHTSRLMSAATAATRLNGAAPDFLPLRRQRSNRSRRQHRQRLALELDRAPKPASRARGLARVVRSATRFGAPASLARCNIVRRYRRQRPRTAARHRFRPSVAQTEAGEITVQRKQTTQRFKSTSPASRRSVVTRQWC